MKEFQSYQAKNVIILMQHFCLQNALKLTYEHLRFQKFFRGLYPRTPASRGASSNSAGRGAYNAEGRGGEGRGGEGRGGEGREGKGREGKGREGKGREGKGREGKGREGKGREGKGREGKGRPPCCLLHPPNDEILGNSL
jgi:hypothetical protein